MFSAFLISSLVILFVVGALILVFRRFESARIRSEETREGREIREARAKPVVEPYLIGRTNNYICTGPREHLHVDLELDACGAPKKCYCGHSIESLGWPQHRYSFSGNYMCSGPRHHLVAVDRSSMPIGKCYCGHDLQRLY